MLRLPLIVLASLAMSACYASRVYSYPEPLPPPPVPYEPAPAAQVSVQIQYSDYHPVPQGHGDGWCTLTGLHYHSYRPAYTNQYVYQNSVWHFGADIDYTYDAGRHGHPIPSEYGGGWCNSHGPHSHRYRPWVDYDYDRTRRVYVYQPDNARRVTTPRPSQRPIPSYPTTRPTPTYPTARPTPTYPTARPTPTYPTTRPTPTQPTARPTPTQPTRPTPAQPTPIPYGHDNRPQQYPRPAPQVRTPTPAPARPATPAMQISVTPPRATPTVHQVQPRPAIDVRTQDRRPTVRQPTPASTRPPVTTRPGNQPQPQIRVPSNGRGTVRPPGHQIDRSLPTDRDRNRKIDTVNNNKYKQNKDKNKRSIKRGDDD